jgi:hypothetical protein
MRRKPRNVRGFYTMDYYASGALGTRVDIGMSMADSQIQNAKQMFSYRVIPDIDDDSLLVECADTNVAERVTETLFGWSSSRELWDQPNLCMELRSWVTSMISYRDVYVHFVLDRVDETDPWGLVFAGWLPPETVVVRGHGTRRRFEQFISKRWPEGGHISVMGGPREFLETFTPNEILHLRWPLHEPSRTKPAEAVARRAGRPIDRQADRILAAARAGAEPEETFLPLARGRAGAYAGSIYSQKLHDALVGDRLFLPPDEDITEYFYVDRLVRSRIAACQVREYLLGEVSRQLLGTWAECNGWPRLSLRLRRQCWSVSDWRELHHEYRSGSARVEDVVAAAVAEQEALPKTEG